MNKNDIKFFIAMQKDAKKTKKKLGKHIEFIENEYSTKLEEAYKAIEELQQKVAELSQPMQHLGYELHRAGDDEDDEPVDTTRNKIGFNVY